MHERRPSNLRRIGTPRLSARDCRASQPTPALRRTPAGIDKTSYGCCLILRMASGGTGYSCPPVGQCSSKALASTMRSRRCCLSMLSQSSTPAHGLSKCLSLPDLVAVCPARLIRHDEVDHVAHKLDPDRAIAGRLDPPQHPRHEAASQCAVGMADFCFGKLLGVVCRARDTPELASLHQGRIRLGRQARRQMLSRETPLWLLCSLACDVSVNPDRAHVLRSCVSSACAAHRLCTMPRARLVSEHRVHVVQNLWDERAFRGRRREKGGWRSRQKIGSAGRSCPRRRGAWQGRGSMRMERQPPHICAGRGRQAVLVGSLAGGQEREPRGAASSRQRVTPAPRPRLRRGVVVALGRVALVRSRGMWGSQRCGPTTAPE